MREERQLGAGNAGLMVPAGAAGWERRFTSKKRVEGGGGRRRVAGRWAIAQALHLGWEGRGVCEEAVGC